MMMNDTMSVPPPPPPLSSKVSSATTTTTTSSSASSLKLSPTTIRSHQDRPNVLSHPKKNDGNGEEEEDDDEHDDEHDLIRVKSFPTSKHNHPTIRWQVGEMDVICGRGKAGFNHPGNVRFRTAVMQAMHDYHRAEDRTEKPTIVHAIISHTYSTGGCFLRRDNQLPPHSQRDVNPNKNADSITTTAWVELNFQEQKDKVRHALRDAIAEMKIKQMKSVQCRHEQLLSSRNDRSTTTGNSTSPTIASSNVVMDPVVSMSHLSNSKPLMPTTSIVDDRNYGVVLPSSSNISNIWNTAFPTAPSAVVQQLLLQHHAATTPSTSTNPSATIPNSCESGYPGHQQGTTTMMGPVRNDDLAAQLATQLQLVQMNSQNNMSVSLTLQLYQQLQKEQEIQNVQNFIAMNATKLALQRDCINLQAYVAHLQNLKE